MCDLQEKESVSAVAAKRGCCFSQQPHQGFGFLFALLFAHLSLVAGSQVAHPDLEGHWKGKRHQSEDQSFKKQSVLFCYLCTKSLCPFSDEGVPAWVRGLQCVRGLHKPDKSKYFEEEVSTDYTGGWCFVMRRNVSRYSSWATCVYFRSLQKGPEESRVYLFGHVRPHSLQDLLQLSLSGCFPDGGFRFCLISLAAVPEMERFRLHHGSYSSSVPVEDSML